MKRVLVGSVLVVWLVMSPPVYAGVTEWPVIGQVVRVGQCVVGGTGKLVASLLSHLGAWGTELVQTVGQCALHTTSEVTDVAEDVVSLTIPTPDLQPEVSNDVPPQ